MMSKGQNKGAHSLDLAGRNPARPFEIDIAVDEALAADLAARVGAVALHALHLRGRAESEGRHGWKLSAHLTGQGEQACVVSGEPVITDIAADITRVYRDDLPAPGPGESEMPEDIDVEPMPERLNLIDVMAEEIALSLPDYPRAADLPPVEAQSAPDNASDEGEEKENPFNVLQSLKLKDDPEDDER